MGRRGGRDDRDLNPFLVVIEMKIVAVVVVVERMRIERLISSSLEAVEDSFAVVAVCHPTVMVGSPVNLSHYLVVHLVHHY